MKKTKIFTLITVLIVMIAIIFSCTRSYAIEPRTIDTTAVEGETQENGNSDINPISANPEENQENVEEHSHDDIYNDDLYYASNQEEYVMDQLVDGNAYIFGHDVKITGEVNGSVFICATTVEIADTAWIGGNLFVLTGNLKIDGMVSDVYAVSRNISLGENALIGRDLRALSENVELAGEIYRNVFLSSENVKITDPSKLTIYGDLNYEATEEIANAGDAAISGNVNFKQYEEKSEKTENKIVSYVFDALDTVIFDAVLYILLLVFAPKFINKSKEYISTRGILAFAIGIAFIVLIPILALLLMIINLGTGLSLLAIFIYIVVLLVNSFAVVVSLSEFIADKLNISNNKVKKGLLLAGVSLVVWILRNLPVIGSIISMLVLLCGIGIVILYQFDRIKKVKEIEA